MHKEFISSWYTKTTSHSLPESSYLVSESICIHGPDSLWVCSTGYVSVGERTKTSFVTEQWTEAGLVSRAGRVRAGQCEAKWVWVQLCLFQLQSCCRPTVTAAVSNWKDDYQHLHWPKKYKKSKLIFSMHTENIKEGGCDSKQFSEN